MDKRVNFITTEEKLDWVENLEPTRIELKPNEEFAKPQLPDLIVGETPAGRTRVASISMIDERHKLLVANPESFQKELQNLNTKEGK